MNAERTDEILNAYVRAKGGTEWEELVTEAVAALLPDTDEWLVVKTDKGPSILALEGEALYRLLTIQLEDRAAMSAERFALGDGRARASVVETKSLAYGSWLRRRTWSFALEGDRHIEWTTEPLREGDQLSREERIARAIARITGWPL